LKKINILIILLFLIGNISFSQLVISGFTKDIQNNPLSNVNLILKSNNSQSIISYCYSSVNGNYELKTNKVGKFILVISALNYETQSIDIKLDKEQTQIEKNIILSYKATELNEVIIQSERPITIKKDTITFLAKSFLQGNEQVVEDLLKKIPGLNVLPDGTIKIGNQEVEKIMIEGDDMFEKGYKILSKNMPVNPIEKVELFQNYSNNKLLKGIENSNKVALNLTLKENAKRVWFGNMRAGYGLVSQNRYEVNSNLMNFGKKNKFYFLTSLNNTGENATGDINHLIRPYRFDEPANIGDDQTAVTLLSTNTDLPGLKQKRVDFNNAEMLCLNTIFNVSTKIKIKILGFLNTDENDFFRNSFQSFTTGSTTFTNTEQSINRKTQITNFGKLDLTYDISKTKTLKFTSKFNNTNEKNRSDLNFNNDLLNERLTSSNQLIDQKIVFTSKLKTQKVVLISGRYINEKTPQDYLVNQFIFGDLFAENANSTKQHSQNQMEFAGFDFLLLDKKENGDLLEIKFVNQLRIDKLNTQFELLDQQSSLSFPPNYQNKLIYTTYDFNASAKYRFKFGNYTLLTQSEFHQLFNKLENINFKSNQKPFFIVPKIGIDWKINTKNQIITSYSLTTTNAGLLDVYSGFVQTGFRSFQKGLEQFNQLNSSIAVLNYSYGSWGDKFFANTLVLFSKNNDFFSSNSLITQNYSQSQKIIIKDREFLSISTNLDRYFKPIKSNLKIILNASKTEFKNIVNNSDFREIKNYNAQYGLEIRSVFKGIMNYHLGSKWSYNQIKATSENSFTNNQIFLDLSFEINNKLNLEIQTERYYFGNLEKNNNQYYFLDFETRYVVKENKLTFSLSGNNLFNTETFRNYTISDVAISQTEYKLQPRYILLKTEFRF
jgi:hypothetical protein